MSKITCLKRLILLFTYLTMNFVLFGQGEIKKVKAFDIHAGFEGYRYYLLDSLICSSEYDTISKREIFRKVTQWPVYGDSIQDTLKYIYNNLKSPDPYADLWGTVFVQFIVELDGTLTNFKILRGLHPKCDKEAIDVLKNMPKWTPGKCNGEKVPVYFIIPINIRPYL